MALFDRTWYGGSWSNGSKASHEKEWKRAYGQIVAFERILSRGTILVKFWLHISSKEQLVVSNAGATTFTPWN